MNSHKLKTETTATIQNGYQLVGLTRQTEKASTIVANQHLRTVSTSTLVGTVSLRYTPRDVAPSKDVTDEQ
jgi:hypothetical protein